jgi:hypothetical protein
MIESRSFHNAPLPSAFTSSIGAKMIKVTAGSFVIGSPEDEQGRRPWEQQHEVTLTHDFYLGETPVTQGQYEALTGENPSFFPFDNSATRNNNAPVDHIFRDEAIEFCRKLTETDRRAGVLPADWEYRLPTEAEWEYASRAGNPSARYGELAAIAWHFGNSEDRTHPVGEKLPNAWGFYDMLGNVWEYCQYCFHVGRKWHAVRGGSFLNSADCCRFAAREMWGRGRYVGFRLLAGPTGIACTPANATFPVDNIQLPRPKVNIYDAIDRNDPVLAERVVAEDPAQIESIDAIPPPIHAAIWSDKPRMVEWLLDHGADIDRHNQDFGATPLVSAVTQYRDGGIATLDSTKEMISILVARGANTEGAMEAALFGLAGGYENNGIGRDGFKEIVEFLRELGVK